MSETDGKEFEMQGRPDIQESWQIDGGEVVSEIERYLAVVDLFREEGCEPVWADEPDTALAMPVNEPANKPISVEPEARDLV